MNANIRNCLPWRGSELGIAESDISHTKGLEFHPTALNTILCHAFVVTDAHPHAWPWEIQFSRSGARVALGEIPG